MADIQNEDHLEDNDTPATSIQPPAQDPTDPSPTEWPWTVAYYTITPLLIFLAIFLLMRLLISVLSRRKLKKWKFDKLKFRPVVVGFFHPYCNAGGGGERVLWHSICALQKRYNFVRCVVYTGQEPNVTPKTIVKKVRDRFGIDLQGEDVKFVFLKWRRLVEADCWWRFTILGQNIGSIILGFEALLKFAPNVYIDTMGYAFTMPLFRWIGGCKTASYVHYPTVSQDMLNTVSSRESSFNNANWIRRSRFLTSLKLLYYRIFAKMYGCVGRRSDIVMVNSTWTHGHISKIWGARRLFIVYPPCDTSTFQQLPIERNRKEKFNIISIGQFRPEKNHEQQLYILKDFLEQLNDRDQKKVRLVLLGSCRNREDDKRVEELKELAKHLKISKNLQFKVNATFEQLKQELTQATAAIHTMSNEHFGIGLVECMAAGCVMIGHDSGGPQMDIIVEWRGQRTGYLASGTGNFVSCLIEVFHLPELDRRVLVKAARESVRAKFSVEVFEASFLRATEHLFG